MRTLLGFASRMTYKAINPVVQVVEQIYQTGVRLTQKAMNELEKRFQRLEGLEKWFVTIQPLSF